MLGMSHSVRIISLESVRGAREPTVEGSRLATLSIDLLGGFAARLATRDSLEITGRKTRALVAYLALKAGQACPREELVGLLWGDRGEVQARSSLRQSLSELRKALGDAGDAVLVAGRDTVALDAEALEVDAVEFERLAGEATPAALVKAAALYRGDLLKGLAVPDAAFEDWLAGERTRLRECACGVLNGLLARQAESGDAEAAIFTAQRLLALDPLQEAVHRTLMRLYAGRGERTLALKQYKACREVLAAELGVDPEAETNRLADEIRAGAAGKDRDSEPTPEAIAQPDAPPLPDKPSVAVLPFANLSGDPEQDYFADGLTGDIITQLSRFRSLFVIGITSSLLYKGETPKIQDVGRELGVAYVAQGNVRKAGNRVRITVELVEAATGRQLWAERYDRKLEDIFAVQDEVTSKVVSTLAGHIEHTDRQRATSKRSDDLAAYELVLLGEQEEREFTKDGVLRARALFQQAIERDPGSARAHASMARTFLDELWSDWTMDWDAAAEQAFDWARKAVALDALDNRARSNLGVAYHLAKGNFEAAQVQFAKALELNPNDADAYCLQGWCHVYAGEGDEAIVCTDRAMRLTPFDLDDCLSAQFTAHYIAQRYVEALASLARIPDPGCTIDAFRAACYAQLGRAADARQALDTFMSEAPEEIADWPGEDPKAWRRYWTQQYPFQDFRNLEHLLDGFRKAGLPV